MTPETDVTEFIDALLGVHLPDNYSAVDEYRDFHGVFSTPQGQRVLSRIMAHCEGRMPRPEAAHAELAGYVARRKVGLWISKTASMPPRQQEAQGKPPR